MSLRELFLLRPDVVFLNHGSFGACPRPVFERYQAWQLELERQPVEFLGLERRFQERMAQARAGLAAYIHCDPDDVVYQPNSTTAVNLVARSLALQPGGEILSSDHEYGACERAWEFMCQKTGARYVRQPIPVPVTSPEAIVETFWAGVSERTKVIFLSHVTSPTALTFPVREICRRARQAGILSVVDGSHAPGYLPLDMDDIGADVYTGNCHKWLCSPKGAGFLFARRECQPLLEPLVISWGWHTEYPGPSRFVDENEWQATRDISAYLSVPVAIDFQAEHHWPDVWRSCHQLARQARQRITALTGLEPLSPDDKGWYNQMVTVPLPPCDRQLLKGHLLEDYHIEVPLVEWQNRPFIRISIQAYNTQDDIDRLVIALNQLLSNRR